MMMMGGWGFLNMIFWIAIIGLIIYALFALITKPFEKKEDPAINLLRERFARGEISEEEFEQRKGFLTKK
jgi:putative membrane protein